MPVLPFPVLPGQPRRGRRGTPIDVRQTVGSAFPIDGRPDADRGPAAPPARGLRPHPLTPHAEERPMPPKPSPNCRVTRLVLLAAVCLLVGCSGAAETPVQSGALSVNLGGTAYLHRWSKGSQHEFTPADDADLTQWRDMLTINVHPDVRTGEQLAQLANTLVGNYERHGRIIRTDSRPRTSAREAEHLLVAVLGNPGFLEAAFARVVLVDGVGHIAVRSHRIHGPDVGPAMGAWLEQNGQSIEDLLMGWDGIPPQTVLASLPQQP